MPPIAQKNYCPLYRIDYLVTKKSYAEKKSQRSIYNEICAMLDISKIRLWRLRRYQVGDPGGLSTVELIKLAEYFDTTLDDLVVKEPSVASSPNLEPGSPQPSTEGAGICSTPTSPITHD